MICITPSWSRQGVLGISDFSCSTFSIGPWMISYSLRNVDPWLISSWIESMFWGIFEEWRGSYSLQFKMNVQDHPSASVYWIQHHPACNYDYESRFGRYRFYTNIDFWRIQNFFFRKNRTDSIRRGSLGTLRILFLFVWRLQTLKLENFRSGPELQVA